MMTGLNLKSLKTEVLSCELSDENYKFPIKYDMKTLAVGESGLPVEVEPVELLLARSQ